MKNTKPPRYIFNVYFEAISKIILAPGIRDPNEFTSWTKNSVEHNLWNSLVEEKKTFQIAESRFDSEVLINDTAKSDSAV